MYFSYCAATRKTPKGFLSHLAVDSRGGRFVTNPFVKREWSETDIHSRVRRGRPDGVEKA